LKLLKVTKGVAFLKAEDLEELFGKRPEYLTKTSAIELAILIVKKLEEFVEADAYVVEVKIKGIDEEKVVETLNIVLYEASKRLRKRVYVKPLK